MVEPTGVIVTDTLSQISEKPYSLTVTQSSIAPARCAACIKSPVITNASNRVVKIRVKQKASNNPYNIGNILMGILFVLLLLGILVLTGFMVYWIIAWAYTLALSTAYTIAITVLAILALTLVMAALLALWFVLLHSYAHREKRIKPYYPE